MRWSAKNGRTTAGVSSVEPSSMMSSSQSAVVCARTDSTAAGRNRA
jgi:hypothetical protein